MNCDDCKSKLEFAYQHNGNNYYFCDCSHWLQTLKNEG